MVCRRVLLLVMPVLLCGCATMHPAPLSATMAARPATATVPTPGTPKTGIVTTSAEPTRTRHSRPATSPPPRLANWPPPYPQ
ncbi:hypothetical protein ACWGCW_25940 [Streptomyces sp. NPDC054933]